MKFFILLFFLSPLFIQLNAQMLLNQDGEAFTDVPFFNPTIIRTNHIKTIEGNFAIKKTGEIVKPNSDYCRYQFDESGRLIEHLEIHYTKNKKDTLLHQFSYNQAGKLTEHRRSELGAYTCLKFFYDSLENPYLQQTFREIFYYPTHSIRDSFLINEEYFDSKSFPNAKEITRFNNYHLPYLTESSMYNQNGYLTEKKVSYLMSSIEHKTKFKYNERGLLVEKSSYNEQEALPDQSLQFKYDEFGNLIEIQEYRFGQFSNELQIVYDLKSQLLGSTIQRDTLTNTLTILRFTKYTYFN